MTRKHTRFTGILEEFNNKGVGRYLKEKIKELPQETTDLAVKKFAEIAPKHLRAMVIKAKDAVGCRWFLRYHFAWGARVREFLNDLAEGDPTKEDLLCHESETPEGSWEFYYSQIVEMALNLHD